MYASMEYDYEIMVKFEINIDNFKMSDRNPI